MSPDVLVVGAGPAGLGTAAMLRRAGLNPLIVERGDAIAPNWRARYDGFRLNTSSWFSHLPGKRFDRRVGRWPSRDDIVAYYDAYADAFDLEIRLATSVEHVEHVERRGESWALVTDQGVLEAPYLVIATGKYRTPKTPDWPGRGQFTGEVVHSAMYRNAEPYRGKRALVVGPGNSGFEIALQLSEGGACPVHLSVRTPPHLIHRDIGPLPSDLFAVLGRRLPVKLVDAASARIRRFAIGDLSPYGLVAPSDGLYSRLRQTGMIPTIDGRFIDGLKRRTVSVVPAVEALEQGQVLLRGGLRLDVDVVIAATGYSRDLEALVGHLGVLDDDGRPLVNGAEMHSAAPGLFFIGFSEPLSGNLREIRLDASRIAPKIRRLAR